MTKQRKRVSTKMILDAANWVGANLHSINDMINEGVKLSKSDWCKLLSEGVGEQFTIPTALEILSANGVDVTPAKTAEKLETRVLSLEQQVIELIRNVAELQQSPYDKPENGLLPLEAYPKKEESEVADVFARS